MPKVLIYLNDKNLERVNKLAIEQFDGNRSRCVSELATYVEKLEQDIKDIKAELMELRK
ncbi:MAG: hypothetical protein LBT75_00310 [Bacilli bacterium]|nr:hypothetical protein [Bacilli bacterium]